MAFLHTRSALTPKKLLLICLCAAGCAGSGADVQVTTGREVPPPPGDSIPPPQPLQNIPPEIIAKVQPHDGWDFPVGPPNARNYYKARGFLPEGLEHLGEDWNGTGGGNSDWQDFVYAAADGVVWQAENFGKGWGQVVRILHNEGTVEKPRYMESVYVHLASMWVHPGNRMKRGEIIGTIGTGEGKFHAHLHFEMRFAPGKYIRCGYDGDTAGFISPTPYIHAHRPAGHSGGPE